MSEHIQPTPSPHAPPPGVAVAEAHKQTPGVAYERERFDFRTIAWVGAGLVITAVVVHVAVWWLLGGLESVNAVPAGSISELAQEEADKPLGQRLDNVPAPHLEGIERESSLIVLRTENGEETRFFGSPEIRVEIDHQQAKLFELREGQRVTLTYFLPGGVGGAMGVVTSVTYPAVKAEQKKPEAELPDVSRTINGEIVRIEPRSISASRDWAEVQMQNYGWIDRDKGIVHIPVEKAMEEAAEKQRLGTTDNRKKGAGRLALPSRSSSGREAAGGKP
jgi:hypothetical protein